MERPPRYNSYTMDKHIVRQELLAARAALSPEQVAADSALVCQHLAEWPPFRQARTVLAYLAFDNEVSLQALIDGYPQKSWALPRTLRGGVLALHRYQPGRLVRHRWGMLEPAADAPPVPLTEIELVLVPGVGFDEQGGRLGFGGGYYDRLLPRLTCLKVGIAHLTSCLPLVPCDVHDCRMDWLARPDGLIRVRPETG
jgi:5-formyltetrahydrofolate cyclo-ligase